MVFRLPRVTHFVTIFHVFLSVEDIFYDVVFFNVAIVSPWGIAFVGFDDCFPDSISDTDSGPVTAGNDIEALGPTLARPMSYVSASTATTSSSGRPARARTTVRRPAPVITPGSAARPRAATVAATRGRGRGRMRRAV